MLMGTMMSSGGDEVNERCWDEDEETTEALQAGNLTIAKALNGFVQEVQGVMHQNGKMPFIKSGTFFQSSSVFCCSVTTCR